MTLDDDTMIKVGRLSLAIFNDEKTIGRIKGEIAEVEAKLGDLKTELTFHENRRARHQEIRDEECLEFIECQLTDSEESVSNVAPTVSEPSEAQEEDA